MFAKHSDEQETDSSLQHPEINAAFWYLEFTPITLLLDFQPIELEVKACAM